MNRNLFERVLGNENSFSDEEIKYLDNLVSRQVLKKESNTYILNSKYLIATVSIKKDYAILDDIVNEHKKSKIDFNNLEGANEGDLVIAKRNFNPRIKSKAKVIEIVNKEEKTILVYKDENKIYTLKDAIALNVKLNIKNGEVALINSKDLIIQEVLGDINDASIDEKISLYIYGEDYRLKGFSDFTAISEISFEGRVDLTSLPFCTIDPASAKDHDDAIYYDNENEILYVAIADVSHFVEEGSILDEEAFKRTSSVYFPGRVLPMLPNSLSEDLCSLKPEINRYAYVFKIFLEGTKVLRSELFEAVINSHAKFSYGRIDRVLDGKLDNYTPMQKEIFDYLVPLYDITKQIRAKRLKTGYDFRNEENRLKLDRNSKLQSIEVESSTPSHQLIEECMLLANIEASKKLQSVGIYRIHEEPSLQAISKLVDEVNMLGLNVKVQEDVHSTILAMQKKAENLLLSAEVDELIIQAQSKAKYASKNLGHFGLGFESYSHFTSPIRRYSDLILHRMLKKIYNSKDIDTKCDYISNKEVLIDRLVWDLEDRKYARYAQEHIGEEFYGKIVDTEKHIVKIDKVICGMRVYIDNYAGQNLFKDVKVVILKSDIIHKKIYGKIV